MEQNTDVCGGMARFIRRFGLSILGVALVILWGIWWGNSLRHNHLISGHRTWICQRSQHQANSTSILRMRLLPALLIPCSHSRPPL